MPARSQSQPLFNAAGTARRLRASPLFAIGPAEPRPAIRRGFLLAVPIGLALGIELGFDAPTQGAIATGALVNGFPGMDAPAHPRAGWQAASAPLIGIAAALGILSSQTGPTAVLALGLMGLLAGYAFCVSLRLAIVGLSVTLAMLIAQGLFLPASDAGAALLYGTLGGLTQVAWSLIVWIATDRAADEPEKAWSGREAVAALRSNLSLESQSARHALRFGAALAAGVAAYRLLDLHQHGFWIPLTILFVMRPERDETDHRLVLRAIGTVLGLILATAVAEAFAGQDLVLAAVLTVAAAFSFGLLTVQYALFTTAITTYVVLMSSTLGEAAFRAAGQRATGTALGIAIAFLAWRLWPNPVGTVDLASQPNMGGASS
ncbi:MAG TPA: FUSC family protein [Solirubrobacterales bacterium]|nr:FUSC family protein [Solirubrobacterales bacterium]